MKTAIVTDVADMSMLEPAWWDLFARAPSAAPFAAPAWLMPWWRTFAPGQMTIVTVMESDRMIGLAPLYVEEGRWGRRLLPLGIGLSDTLDILVDPTRAEGVCQAIGRALRDVLRSVDCWSAEDAPPNAAVLALSTPEGWTSTITAQSACPTLTMPNSGVLRDAIPARQWRKWRMARNRAARRSCAIIETSPSTLVDDLVHLFRLHTALWESRGERGVLADLFVQRFHFAAAPALLAAGFLRLFTLHIDSVVAGVYYGLHRGQMAAAYLGGFDPLFSFESPGTLLIGEAIQVAAREGAHAFSFLRGQEAYKYAWGATDEWTQRRLFKPIR